MQTFNQATTSGVSTAPFDPSADGYDLMHDPLFGLVAAALVAALLVFTLRSVPHAPRLWAARAALALLVVIGALMTPYVGSHLMRHYPPDTLARWMGQIALWLLALAAACIVEWVVRTFRR